METVETKMITTKRGERGKYLRPLPGTSAEVLLVATPSQSHEVPLALKTISMDLTCLTYNTITANARP